MAFANVRQVFAAGDGIPQDIVRRTVFLQVIRSVIDPRLPAALHLPGVHPDHQFHWPSLLPWVLPLQLNV